MDYLTNYYKNLSEQLQDKINELQRILNEGRAVTDPVTGETKIVGNDIPSYARKRDETHIYKYDVPKKDIDKLENIFNKNKLKKDNSQASNNSENLPGKTIVGLSQDQIDAANDPSRGGQSGKFGDTTTEPESKIRKNNWMEIEFEPKPKPRPLYPSNSTDKLPVWKMTPDYKPEREEQLYDGSGRNLLFQWVKEKNKFLPPKIEPYT